MAMVAKNLDTFAVMPREAITEKLMPFVRHLMPQYSPGTLKYDDPVLGEVRAVELWDHPDITTEIDQLKVLHPNLLVSVILPATGQAPARCEALAGAGAEIIHLNADNHAQGFDDAQDKHLKDLIRQVHLRLGESRPPGCSDPDCQRRYCHGRTCGQGHHLRHRLPWPSICPMLLALECRLCSHCQDGDDCPVDLGKINERRGTQRMVNLMGAWNNQLLEVLGAMGLREVRRLRGEVGRAMFFEDLEKEIFAPLFAVPPGSETMDRDPN